MVAGQWLDIEAVTVRCPTGHIENKSNKTARHVLDHREQQGRLSLVHTLHNGERSRTINTNDYGGTY